MSPVVKKFYNYTDLKVLEDSIVKNPDVLRELLGKELCQLEKDVILSAVKTIYANASETIGFTWVETMFSKFRKGTFELVLIGFVLMAFLSFAIASLGTSFKVNYCINHVKENASFVDGWKEKVRNLEKNVKYLEKISLPLVPKKDKKNSINENI
jgi:hypothetical protein